MSDLGIVPLSTTQLYCCPHFNTDSTRLLSPPSSSQDPRNVCWGPLCRHGYVSIGCLICCLAASRVSPRFNTFVSVDQDTRTMMTTTTGISARPILPPSMYNGCFGQNEPVRTFRETLHRRTTGIKMGNYVSRRKSYYYLALDSWPKATGEAAFVQNGLRKLFLNGSKILRLIAGGHYARRVCEMCKLAY